jgi:hypothetical protein
MKLDWRQLRKAEKERQLAGGKGVGVGEEPNYTSARKPAPLQYISFNTVLSITEPL